MDTLTIADLEDSTIDALRKTADAHGRSPEEEAAMLIRSGLARSDVLSRRERADAIAAMTPKGVLQTDSTILVREARGNEA
jgi:antitoxin FitA